MNEKIKHLIASSEGTYKQSLGVYQFYTYELQNFSEFLTLEIIDEFVYQLWKHNIDESNNPAFYKALEKCLESFGICHKKNQPQLNLFNAMDNYQNRYYALLIELGEKNHELAKLQYELDYLNGVDSTSKAYANRLIKKVIDRLNEDIYLQDDVDDAIDKLYKVKSIIDTLSYGDSSIDDGIDDEEM